MEFEVERAAYLLAERESPRLVDARAVWRMHDQLHSSRLVEEPLCDDALLRRDGAENAHALFDIGGRLLRGAAFEPFRGEPVDGFPAVQPLVYLFAQV